MKELFESLKSQGIVKRGAVHRDAIASMKFSRLVEIAQSVADATASIPVPPATATMSHSATVALSGGSVPCARLECRLEHVRELSQFACMLSDRVCAYNFFAEYKQPHRRLDDSAEFRSSACDDFAVLLALRPLIDAGLVVPFTPTTPCPHCLVSKFFGPDVQKRLRNARRTLEREHFDNFEFKLSFFDDEYTLEFDGSDKLVPHGGGATVWPRPPAGLEQMPGIHRRVKSGETVTLSKTAHKKMGFGSQLAYNFVQDIGFEMAMSQALGASFVTQLAGQVEFLKSLSNSESSADPGLALKQLESTVPFLPNVDASGLLKIRSREAASFFQYRSALVKAITEMRAHKAEFTEKDARALYADVIAPKLAKLDRAVELAKKDAVHGAAPKVALAAVAAVVSVGLYFGISAPELIAAAKALGLSALGASTTGGMASAIAGAYKRKTAERAIQGEDFYFLWKVKQLAR